MRLILMLLTALSFSASAQVYKWTDANGVTHFGSQPPPGQQEEVDVKPASGSTSDSGAVESDIVRQARELERRKAEEAAKRAERRYNEAASTNQESDVESTSCRRAKIVLQGYQRELRTLLKRGYKQSERQDAEDRVARWENEVAYYCS